MLPWFRRGGVGYPTVPNINQLVFLFSSQLRFHFLTANYFLSRKRVVLRTGEALRINSIVKILISCKIWFAIWCKTRLLKNSFKAFPWLPHCISVLKSTLSSPILAFCQCVDRQHIRKKTLWWRFYTFGHFSKAKNHADENDLNLSKKL